MENGSRGKYKETCQAIKDREHKSAKAHSDFYTGCSSCPDGLHIYSLILRGVKGAVSREVS